jgi:hypothetical protein
MRTAYLGIADRAGLRTLVIETSHASRFLVARASRMNAVCFWVVIDDAFAASVRMELDCGERRNAMTLLQLLLDDIGTIIPSTWPSDDLLDTA